MKNNISAIANMRDKYIKKKIYYLNKYLLKQNEKVAYAYKNLITGDTFTFNFEVCFYSASTIKFLTCLYIYEQAEKNPKILDKKIKLEVNDFKEGSGVLKNNKGIIEYTVKELIYYTLKESDNTAYIKLVNFITTEKLKKYGLSLGAQHTLEGKDLFGITNAYDMDKYLSHLYNYFELNTDLSNELKSTMIAPTYKIIDINTINNNLFVRKYGKFGIAFHEVGIVYDDEPYILIILTQKNELSEKKKVKYANNVAKKISIIHRLIKVENLKKEGCV